MCCGGFFYPSALGILISELHPGDQIIILKGEGYPPAPDETTDIVWKVQGFSALTAGGISISCMSNSDLILTGNHFDSFLVSEDAKAVQKQIDEEKKSEEPESEPE